MIISQHTSATITHTTNDNSIHVLFVIWWLCVRECMNMSARVYVCATLYVRECVNMRARALCVCMCAPATDMLKTLLIG